MRVATIPRRASAKILPTSMPLVSIRPEKASPRLCTAIEACPAPVLTRPLAVTSDPCPLASPRQSMFPRRTRWGGRWKWAPKLSAKKRMPSWLSRSRSIFVLQLIFAPRRLTDPLAKSDAPPPAALISNSGMCNEWLVPEKWARRCSVFVDFRRAGTKQESSERTMREGSMPPLKRSDGNQSCPSRML